MAGDKQWQLTWKGETYHESELTLALAEEIGRRVGTSWLELVPIAHARAVLAVMAADRVGVDFDEVYAEIGQVHYKQFAREHIDLVDTDVPGAFENGFPQPPAGERSTGT